MRDILPLDRPLVALDVETHDTRCQIEQARIVEIGFIMLYPDGHEPKRYNSLIKPDLMITPEGKAVHGISNEDVASRPMFKQIASSLAKGFTDCDFAGYNVKFDLKVIQCEMQRAGIQWSYSNAHIVDALRMWQIAEPRSLSDAVNTFLDREPRMAHRALEDAEDALDVAIAQLHKYPKLPRHVKLLHEKCFPQDPNSVDPDGKFVWRGGTAVFGFGKYRDKSIEEVLALDSQYLSKFMLGGDFSPEVKTIINNALQGNLPTRG